MMIVQQFLKTYTRQSRRIWSHLPVSFRNASISRAYGNHVHSLVRSYAERNQNHSTFFLRNRPELESMVRLLEQKPQGATVDFCVVACSKGAEVYSIAWRIRSARPDLILRLRAIDISQEVVDFAKAGVYSTNRNGGSAANSKNPSDITWKDQIWGEQSLSMFERMADREIEEMFEVEGGVAKIRPALKEGITWLQGDATDPQFANKLGLQDVVVANRFLCHMKPADAEKCLRNIARLVKKGGHLFVSGVDLEVRTKVARELGWQPVRELLKEVHEGDSSLLEGWPLDYWGVEPFSKRRPDWDVYFASVFQIV